MIYLLDANVLIDANRDYYPIDSVQEFWDWLVFQGNQGNVKIPAEIYEELKNGSSEDQLTVWAKNKVVEDALLLDEDPDPELVQKVVFEGYADDLTDIEVDQLGQDPFLIAYALGDVLGRRVVTKEVSRPSKRRQNRKVPDVCATFGITSINAFEFNRALGFRTDWNKP